ncbi:GlcG/HbpS family heme-binding protein [Segetibacter koreensis]|uniref:GlcG/HbpS family heme-binding protein n=1 Tax=Segetibacter koreensis TaxID=398037 RepID=UPI00039B6B22|nr:heme-binding protein [Segetibacter koreensis]
MQTAELSQTIEKIIKEAESLIPHYMQNEEDKRIANGNVSICIIDPDGKIYGRMYGTNKIRSRESFRVAWTKASQVHITGMKTGEYEKLAFNNELDENKFGIERPDYIGWEGGQPITLPDGTILSVGFSGFRGVVDLEIVVRALAEVIKK